MKFIVMLISMAAATHSYEPGDIVKVSDEVAEAWIDIGYAKIFEENPVKVADLDKDNDDAKPPDGIELVSRGVYRLPTGETVKGKHAAEEAYAAYLETLQEQEGGLDADKGSTTTDDGASDASGSEEPSED